ncbi:alcohol dehydrogenase [Drosophila grimshawi]|uniref:Alcohol dehydrogenase n=1 Tax=Drosophila grimshawi TaxID=7222 RepID=B4J0U6_DROGR|nr:alcohol dehydrogenase [Drosophila grimshawi]EDV95767.1 GH15889 [Drosophila grimshawi]
MDLAGKNVVYLGSFGGIGQKACAELLGRKIKALAVFDLTLNEQLLTTWQTQYPNTEIFYQKLDITQKSEIEAAYKAAGARLGHFDLVVNGIGLINDQLVELTIQINLLGVIQSCLIALQYMDKAQGGKGGLIVNFSSIAGIEPASTVAIYSAAKHGVTAFTRGLSNPGYYENTGVGFITICPGFTDTPLLDGLTEKSTLKYDIPVKRLMNLVKRQTAQECATNLVKVIEQGQNGSVWLLDLGEMTQIEMPVMWKPVLTKPV